LNPPFQSVKEPPNRQNINLNILIYRRGRVSRPANNFQKRACSARYFDLLLGAPRSSIYIHIGVALLVFGASLTSAACQKILF